MKQNVKMGDLLKVAIATIILVSVLFSATVFRSGQRDIGVIENIDGISFPAVDDAIHVSEKLAHADVYLKEPAVFKELTLEVTFDPQDLNRLAVGVRENSFWLSYAPTVLYERTVSPAGKQTAAVSIPLTDKLQEADRSIDLMFFATSADASPDVDEGISDRTNWMLYDVTAQVKPALSTKIELKDYIRAVLKKERAL